MKTIKFLPIIFLLLYKSQLAQNIYEVLPGAKGNEISLTIANVSETNPATNVNIVLNRKSSSLSFSKEIETIELIEAKSEAEASFTFDIDRTAPVNLPTGQAGRKDTIDFLITDTNGLMMTKSFIFSYTGPKEFKLEQNFPNPFNPSTTIQYQLPVDARVTLKVYDILGSEVITLVNEEQEAGYKEVKFNAGNFASGMYIYRLSVSAWPRQDGHLEILSQSKR